MWFTKMLYCSCWHKVTGEIERFFEQNSSKVNCLMYLHQALKLAKAIDIELRLWLNKYWSFRISITVNASSAPSSLLGSELFRFILPFIPRCRNLNDDKSHTVHSESFYSDFHAGSEKKVCTTHAQIHEMKKTTTPSFIRIPSASVRREAFNKNGLANQENYVHYKTFV